MCLINVLYCLENAFVRCRLHMYFWLLGASTQTPTGALPLDPAGGLSSPRPPVPTLPPNPGYATVLQICVFLKQFVIIITILRGKCLRPGLWGMDPLCPTCALWKFGATCTQDRHLWIWIYPWISTQKSVDMDMDMDGKFHIHGKPDN